MTERRTNTTAKTAPTFQRRVKDWRTSIAGRLVLGRNYETETRAMIYVIDKDRTLTDRISS